MSKYKRLACVWLIKGRLLIQVSLMMIIGRKVAFFKWIAVTNVAIINIFQYT